MREVIVRTGGIRYVAATEDERRACVRVAGELLYVLARAVQPYQLVRAQIDASVAHGCFEERGSLHAFEMHWTARGEAREELGAGTSAGRVRPRRHDADGREVAEL